MLKRMVFTVMVGKGGGVALVNTPLAERIRNVNISGSGYGSDAG